jgi:hypothetical protein
MCQGKAEYSPVNRVQKPPDASTFFSLLFREIDRTTRPIRVRSAHVLQVELSLSVIIVGLRRWCYGHFLAEFEFPSK